MQKIISFGIIVFCLVLSGISFKILFKTLNQLNTLSIFEITNMIMQTGILALIAIVLLALGITSIQ